MWLILQSFRSLPLCCAESIESVNQVILLFSEQKFLMSESDYLTKVNSCLDKRMRNVSSRNRQGKKPGKKYSFDIDVLLW